MESSTNNNNNKDQLGTGESSRWILESIEIDHMTDVPFGNNNDSRTNDVVKSSLPLNSNGSQTSNLRNRAGGVHEDVVPTLGRLRSSADKGLRSLRFIDKKATAKEGDAWIAIEKRFFKSAVGGKIFRDKFGACVGTFLSNFHFFL